MSASLESVFVKMRVMYEQLERDDKEKYGGGSGPSLKLTLSEVLSYMISLISPLSIYVIDSHIFTIYVGNGNC